MSARALFDRLLSKESRSSYTPERYWEERHQAFRESFKAVAHMCLNEDGNAEQYAVKRARIESVIRRFVPDPAGRTLLDAGCGIGLLTPVYAELGFAVTAVDISPTAIERTKSTGVQAEFVVSTLSALELERRFEVIAAIDILLHIVDDKQWHLSLSSLARHLCPDGVLIILDWLPGPVKIEADYCAARSIEQYEAAFEPLGLIIAAHERFILEHEGATKDLLAVRHRGE